MIFFAILVVFIFLSLVAQEFIPALPWLHHAQVMLTPLFVFYGAMAFPFPLALVLIFYGGFLWDLMIVQVVDNGVELSMGTSILLFALLGTLMHGLRPLFLRGRWEVYSVLGGLFTSVILLGEFLLISLRRGEIVFTEEIAWRIGGPGVVAMVLAPFVYLLMGRVAKLVGHRFTEKLPG